MFCRHCGEKCETNDKFCSSCGESTASSPPKTEVKILNTAPLKSSRQASEILANSKSVYEEYKDKKHKGKSYAKVLQCKWGLKNEKAVFLKAIQDKAIVRFGGHFKPINSDFYEVCFAENSIIFMETPGFNNGSPNALQSSDLVHIVVDKFEVNSTFGTAQSSEVYWRFHFVTKWSGLDRDDYAEQARHIFAEYKMKEGEFTFYFPAGNTEYQIQQRDAVFLEKIDAISAFYKVYLLERTAIWNRSIGLMFGTGFWNDLGE